MRRDLSARFDCRLSGTANVIWSVAAAKGVEVSDEQLTITVDGEPAKVSELLDRHGTRLHHLIAAGERMVLTYRATVTDRPLALPSSDPVDLITYLRPSRYCESDRIGPTAWAQFRGLQAQELLDAVADWVYTKLRYVVGSSQPTDSAIDTLLLHSGVCRDYAHLAIALLRAMNVPARMVSCWAPGLSPMEFHAVAEAYVEGAWVIVDATRKAPRASMVRIATGRDAADTAFLTNHWAQISLRDFQVTAVASTLPNDDHRSRVQLPGARLR